jgi:hypothetical protein
MKLYTKEDFLKAAEFCEVSMIDAKYIIERIDEVADPIELPSDEEIDKTAVEFAKYRATTYEISAFIIGAKMVTNKIQGGNK